MHPLTLFFALLSLFGASTAAPKRDAAHTDCPDSDTDHTSVFDASSAASATWTGKDVCAKGGVCDCSRIKDKNSEEYFQCITNPNCEHCWVSRTTTTTTKSTSTPFSNTTQAKIDFHTMAPGTYTITQNNTVLNIVVTQQTPTRTSSTMVYVTMTQTVVVTVAPETQIEQSETGTNAMTPSSSSSATGTATGDDGCKGGCDCSKVDDKDSREYYECLTDPNCERCRSTFSSSASSTEVSTSTDTASPTTTSSADDPKETCPDYCDCSDLDQNSEEYFQCVTNPVCEKCQRGK